MTARESEPTQLVAAGHRLEHAWLGPPPDRAPTLVFLHEGLGCVVGVARLPRAPRRARRASARLVYSRWGYGRSDRRRRRPRPLRYMHDEALDALPAVLDAARVSRRASSSATSDGAAIAMVFAGSGLPAAQRVHALVLDAPHVFVEDVSVASIAAARDAYGTGDLRERLARHHDDVDGAFWGWNDAWLDPGFRELEHRGVLAAAFASPSLVVQGEDDAYGTLAQVEAIERHSGAPVSRLVLPACGHAPHRDRPDEVVSAVVAFLARLPL